MLIDRYSEEQLIVALAWIHAAFIMIPVVGLILYFEFVEWRERHPVFYWRWRHQPV
jgi:hypothetical protein